MAEKEDLIKRENKKAILVPWRSEECFKRRQKSEKNAAINDQTSALLEAPSELKKRREAMKLININLHLLMFLFTLNSLNGIPLLVKK